jgi:hypothetical protein
VLSPRRLLRRHPLDSRTIPVVVMSAAAVTLMGIAQGKPGIATCKAIRAYSRAVSTRGKSNRVRGKAV